MRRRWQVALAGLGGVVVLASAGCQYEEQGMPPELGETPPRTTPPLNERPGQGGAGPQGGANPWADESPQPGTQSDEVIQGQGRGGPGFQGGPWREREGTPPQQGK